MQEQRAQQLRRGGSEGGGGCGCSPALVLRGPCGAHQIPATLARPSSSRLHTVQVPVPPPAHKVCSKPASRNATTFPRTL